MKKKYHPPEIELIKLDNEISLQLESENNTPELEPGSGDGWSAKAPEYLKNDPYRTNFG